MLTHYLAALLSAAPPAPWHPPTLGGVIIAYLGPNTVLPLASALAAAIGVILMFWRYVAVLVRRIFQAVLRRSPGPVAAETPTRDETRISE